METNGSEVRPLEPGEDDHYEAMDAMNDYECFGVYTNGKLRAVSIDRSAAAAEAILAAIETEDHENHKDEDQ